MGVAIPVGFGLVKMRWRLNTYPNEFIATCGVNNSLAHSAQEIADGINTILAATNHPGAAAKIAVGWSYRGTEATVMTATGPFTAEHTVNVTGTGSAPFPPNISFLVTKTTGRGGRSGKGRMFVPAMQVGESNITPEGLLETTPYNDFFTSWSEVYTAWDATDYPPVLLHADGSTPDHILAFVAQQTVCTQRRRLAR